ncbi:trypsin-1-like [Battus philenor]|uniref:trypsin-1-like n=1 Tax=Battus philenor TaxID=42288 RepID=UPI0035D04E5B
MNWTFILLICVGLSSCFTTETIPVESQKKGLLDWINHILGGSTTQRPSTAKPSSPPEDCPTCQCGIARTHRRIVGGTETKEKEYPWICVLLYNGRFYCGCSLISDFYVLTAAHCTAGFRKDRIKVRFLEHDRSVANETKTIDRKVSAIIRHERYNPGTYDNDIALLKVDERLDLSKVVKKLRISEDQEEPQERGVGTVCLPENELSYAGYNATVAGWGTTEEGGSVSNVLREVTVPVISNMECRNTNYKDRITENMLCAGTEEGGKDACQGDSGGPLHVFNNQTNTWHVAGVVSWGEGCARPKTPGVYTRVNRYLTWIKSNTKDACYCSQKFIKKL